MFTWLCRFMILVFTFNIVAPELAYAQQGTSSAVSSKKIWEKVEKQIFKSQATPLASAKTLDELNKIYADQLEALTELYMNTPVTDGLSYESLALLVMQMHELSDSYVTKKNSLEHTGFLSSFKSGDPIFTPQVAVADATYVAQVRVPPHNEETKVKTDHLGSYTNFVNQLSSQYPNLDKELKGLITKAKGDATWLFVNGEYALDNLAKAYPQLKKEVDSFLNQWVSENNKIVVNALDEWTQLVSENRLSADDMLEYLDPVIPAEETTVATQTTLTAYAAQFLFQSLNAARTSGQLANWADFLPRAQQRALYRLRKLTRNMTVRSMDEHLIEAVGSLRLLLDQINAAFVATGKGNFSSKDEYPVAPTTVDAAYAKQLETAAARVSRQYEPMSPDAGYAWPADQDPILPYEDPFANLPPVPVQEWVIYPSEKMYQAYVKQQKKLTSSTPRNPELNTPVTLPTEPMSYAQYKQLGTVPFNPQSGDSVPAGYILEERTAYVSGSDALSIQLSSWSADGYASVSKSFPLPPEVVDARNKRLSASAPVAQVRVVNPVAQYAPPAQLPQPTDNFTDAFIEELKALKQAAQKAGEGSKEQELMRILLQYAVPYVLLRGGWDAKHGIETMEGMFAQTAENGQHGILNLGEPKMVQPYAGEIETLFGLITDTLLSYALDANTVAQTKQQIFEFTYPDHGPDTRFMALGAMGILHLEYKISQNPQIANTMLRDRELSPNAASLGFSDQSRQIATEFIAYMYGRMARYDGKYSAHDYGLNAEQMQVVQKTLADDVLNLTPVTAYKTEWSAQHKQYVVKYPYETYQEEDYRNSGHNAYYSDRDRPICLADGTTINNSPRIVYVFLSPDINPRKVQAEQEAVVNRLMLEVAFWIVADGIFQFVFRALRYTFIAVKWTPTALKAATRGSKLSFESRVGRFISKLRQGINYSKPGVKRTLSRAGVEVTNTARTTQRAVVTAKEGAEMAVKSAEELFAELGQISQQVGKASAREVAQGLSRATEQILQATRNSTQVAKKLAPKMKEIPSLAKAEEAAAAAERNVTLAQNARDAAQGTRELAQAEKALRQAELAYNEARATAAAARAQEAQRLAQQAREMAQAAKTPEELTKAAEMATKAAEESQKAAKELLEVAQKAGDLHVAPGNPVTVEVDTPVTRAGSTPTGRRLDGQGGFSDWVSRRWNNLFGRNPDISSFHINAARPGFERTSFDLGAEALGFTRGVNTTLDRARFLRYIQRSPQNGLGVSLSPMKWMDLLRVGTEASVLNATGRAFQRDLAGSSLRSGLGGKMAREAGIPRAALSDGTETLLLGSSEPIAGKSFSEAAAAAQRNAAEQLLRTPPTHFKYWKHTPDGWVEISSQEFSDLTMRIQRENLTAAARGGATIEAETVPDFYEVLGVPRDATYEQMKKAYRQAALNTHPDRLAGLPEAEQKMLEERFKQQAAAWDALGYENATKVKYNGKIYTRTQYDALLEQQAVTPTGSLIPSPEGDFLAITPNADAAVSGHMTGGLGQTVGGRSYRLRSDRGPVANGGFGFNEKTLGNELWINDFAKRLYETGGFGAAGVGPVFTNLPLVRKAIGNFIFFTGWEVLDRFAYGIQTEGIMYNRAIDAYNAELDRYPNAFNEHDHLPSTEEQTPNPMLRLSSLFKAGTDPEAHAGSFMFGTAGMLIAFARGQEFISTQQKTQISFGADNSVYNQALTNQMIYSLRDTLDTKRAQYTAFEPRTAELTRGKTDILAQLNELEELVDRYVAIHKKGSNKERKELLDQIKKLNEHLQTEEQTFALHVQEDAARNQTALQWTAARQSFEDASAVTNPLAKEAQAVLEQMKRLQPRLDKILANGQPWEKQQKQLETKVYNDKAYVAAIEAYEYALWRLELSNLHQEVTDQGGKYPQEAQAMREELNKLKTKLNEIIAGKEPLEQKRKKVEQLFKDPAFVKARQAWLLKVNIPTLQTGLANARASFQQELDAQEFDTWNRLADVYTKELFDNNFALLWQETVTGTDLSQSRQQNWQNILAIRSQLPTDYRPALRDIVADYDALNQRLQALASNEEGTDEERYQEMLQIQKEIEQLHDGKVADLNALYVTNAFATQENNLNRAAREFFDISVDPTAPEADRQEADRQLDLIKQKREALQVAASQKTREDRELWLSFWLQNPTLFVADQEAKNQWVTNLAEDLRYWHDNEALYSQQTAGQQSTLAFVLSTPPDGKNVAPAHAGQQQLLQERLDALAKLQKQGTLSNEQCVAAWSELQQYKNNWNNPVQWPIFASTPQAQQNASTWFKYASITGDPSSGSWMDDIYNSPFATQLEETIAAMADIEEQNAFLRELNTIRLEALGKMAALLNQCLYDLEEIWSDKTLSVDKRAEKAGILLFKKLGKAKGVGMFDTPALAIIRDYNDTLNELNTRITMNATSARQKNDHSEELTPDEIPAGSTGAY